ncbi:unnamed protein product [Gordionus sp. m RMFG-2023]
MKDVRIINNLELIKGETFLDSELIQVKKIELEKGENDTLIKGYKAFGKLLNIKNDCIFKGEQVINPQRLRKKFLSVLQEGHIGLYRMLDTMERYFWWPGVNKDIEEMIFRCNMCMINAPKLPKVKQNYWVQPNKPWYRVYIDFFGPIKNFYGLVIIDGYSRWLEIIKVKNINATTTIMVLNNLFPDLGIQ